MFGSNYKNTLFARYLDAKQRDLDVRREQQRQDDLIRRDSNSQAFDQILKVMQLVEGRRDRDEQNRLKALQLESQAAGRLGREAPQPSSGTALERQMIDAGYGAGEVAGSDATFDQGLRQLQEQRALAGAQRKWRDSDRNFELSISPQLARLARTASDGSLDDAARVDAYNQLQQLGQQHGVAVPQTTADMENYASRLEQEAFDADPGVSSQFGDYLRGQGLTAFDAERDPSVYSGYQDERFRRAKAAGTSVNVGQPQSDPTNTVKTDLQKRIVALNKATRQYGKLRDLNPERFLGYGNRAYAVLLSEADKADMVSQLASMTGKPEAQVRQDVADFTTFSQVVMQMFNDYRKAITGAAASEKELKQLLKSTLNENLGPEAFMARLNNMQDEARVTIEENARVLGDNDVLSLLNNPGGKAAAIKRRAREINPNPSSPEEARAAYEQARRELEAQ